MPHKPLCFVLMPFGHKSGHGEQKIDFDAVYEDIIRIAVQEAGLEPLRADEETVGGIIHKPMFERLVLCEYAIADLTTANANVFYELGVRHAAKPRTTILLYAEHHGRLPFDVAPLRALSYQIGSNGAPTNSKDLRIKLSQRLTQSRSGSEFDSPLFQLLEDYPNISHEKTDVFRERVSYAKAVKSRLALARKGSQHDVAKIEAELGEIVDLETAIVVDILLSYRAVEAWDDMIRLEKCMDEVLRRTVLVREQLGFALNRAGRSIEAESVLSALIEERGPSSETLGILGRVYKDRWVLAKANGELSKASSLLGKVAETYKKGFEADWRDAYPGINALTFLRMLDPDSKDYKSLRPIVEYALNRKIASGAPDYWDYATRMELAVLDGDKNSAVNALGDVLASLREPWEAKTTLNNLQMIRESLIESDSNIFWMLELEDQIKKCRQF